MIFFDKLKPSNNLWNNCSCFLMHRMNTIQGFTLNCWEKWAFVYCLLVNNPVSKCRGQTHTKPYKATQNSCYSIVTTRDKSFYTSVHAVYCSYLTTAHTKQNDICHQCTILCTSLWLIYFIHQQLRMHTHTQTADHTPSHTLPQSLSELLLWTA